MTIEETINKIAALSSESIALLKQHFSVVTFQKGHILFDSTRVERDMYFIKKGIARAYSISQPREVTFWFGKEGDGVISMRSYVADEKSYEKVELLEDAQLYKINMAKLRELFKTDIEIANWGRRFAEKELLRTEERFMSREFKTAKERYKDLIDNDPQLLNRVPLGHLATYLGITQVSLSRVRAAFK